MTGHGTARPRRAMAALAALVCSLVFTAAPRAAVDDYLWLRVSGKQIRTSPAALPANDIFVPGADSGLAGFRRFWRASDVNVIDGLLQYVDVNPLYRPQEGTPITSEGVFQERANSMLELRKQTPVIISGGALSQRAPVTVPDLFPGSLWVLDMADEGISSLVTVQRLKRVDVSVSKSGGGYVEKVSPTLMPLGTEE